MKVGFIGLENKAFELVSLLNESRHSIVVYHPVEEFVYEAVNQGIEGAFSILELSEKLGDRKVRGGRVFWVMVSYNEKDAVFNELEKILVAGDTIIDSSPAFYKNSMRKSKDFERIGVEYLDVGVLVDSENGFRFFIGGRDRSFSKLEKLFKAVSTSDEYLFLEKPGAGHFVKFVNDVIGLGVSQSFTEGFDLLKNSEFSLDLEAVLTIFGKSSYEGKAVDALLEALDDYGENFINVQVSSKDIKEGEWLKDTAKRLNVNVRVLEKALSTIKSSRQTKNYQSKIMSLLDK